MGGWSRGRGNERRQERLDAEPCARGATATACHGMPSMTIGSGWGRRRMAPGPRPRFLLGNIPEFREDPLGFLRDSADRHGDIVGLWFGPRSVVYLRHPDQIEHVLQVNQRNYRKQTRLSAVLGEGLGTSNGDRWHRRRRQMSPAFRHDHLAAYATVMEQVIGDQRDRWQRLAGTGASFLVDEEMMRLTFRIVGVTMFGEQFAGVVDQLHAAISVLRQEASRRLYRLAAPPLWIPTRPNREFQAALAVLDRVVYALIAERRREAPPTGEPLATLLAIHERDAGNGRRDRELRDEIVTLLLAGHENSGSALAWAWWLISLHPEVERRIQEEVTAVAGDRPPTWVDLPRLIYTRLVVLEALRLYPPGWIVRVAQARDRIAGFDVAAGGMILISPFLTHRHPEYWPQPELFVPERFADGGVQVHHRFAYIPFGAGPRTCIGGGFAATELQLAIALLVQRFHLALVRDHPVVPHPTFSLTARYGIRGTLHTR